MATEKVELDQISDEELFDATEPEAAEPEAEPEAAEAKESSDRDEKGRFVKKAEEEPEPEVSEEPEAEAKPEEQPETEKQDLQQIPSWRLKEEADARREWQKKAEDEAQRRTQIEQQLWQIQQQLAQQQQPQPEPIDPIQDPEGWALSQQQTVDQRIRALEGNFSLRLAKATHKELFDEAWQEMINRSQSGDDTMRQQVLNSTDPGETLVGLYKQAKTFREVNGDPNAWLEAKKQEWLADPQVQAQVLEAAKGTAAQNASTQSQPQVKLPQSLNKAGASGRPSSAGMSDAELWEGTL